MRRWLWFWMTLGLVSLVCGLGSVGALAYQQPFPPGHALYPAQQRLGQWLVSSVSGDLQVQLALHLMARHLVWMEAARGSDRELAALQGFHQTLLLASRALDQATPQIRLVYQAQWVQMLVRGRRTLEGFTQAPQQAPERWQQVLDEVDQALALVQREGPATSELARLLEQAGVLPEATPTAAALSGTPTAMPPAVATARREPSPTPLASPLPIAFPTDFAQRHTFFPLTGQHLRIPCEACHTGGRFAGIPRSCRVCHMQDRPRQHYEGECSLCHTTQAWLPARFDHAAAAATDCIACHLKDRPPNHFPGQCSQCHNTQAWKPAFFRHRFPLNHGGANGVCSTCHPSGLATYSCAACHAPARMRAEHAEEGIFNIAGRCAVCHPDGREGERDDD